MRAETKQSQTPLTSTPFRSDPTSLIPSSHIPRYAGILLPRGLQALLPSSDQLHVRRCQALCSGAAGLHLLHVAAARRGGHRDAALVRGSHAAQRAGAPAGPAHPHRAAHQRQGRPFRMLVKYNSGMKCCILDINSIFDRLTQGNRANVTSSRWFI